MLGNAVLRSGNETRYATAITNQHQLSIAFSKSGQGKCQTLYTDDSMCHEVVQFARIWTFPDCGLRVTGYGAWQTPNPNLSQCSFGLRQYLRESGNYHLGTWATNTICIHRLYFITVFNTCAQCLIEITQSISGIKQNAITVNFIACH